MAMDARLIMRDALAFPTFVSTGRDWSCPKSNSSSNLWSNAMHKTSASFAVGLNCPPVCQADPFFGNSRSAARHSATVSAMSTRV